MNITKQEYEAACKARAAAEAVMKAYNEQERQAFDKRYAEFREGKKPFTDEELIYSAHKLCSCGHGLAYPKNCSPCHHWDCSAILKGIADKGARHTDQLPFTFYSVLSELQKGRTGGATTRGVFKPRRDK